ncbi:Zn(2+) transporter ZRT3 [Aspergillus saccharolyticus JOP 1030-1]|uniref:ZIP metal ion transporter n=1 Tax=Aspergillus saccharolyticus JOP 1030-1 TaxID=1450539 RepID=A0A318ZFM5_9EURO|nr:hypothetical protein BP01DRAFT_339106 [Aspergillus saccharolyticus JOP 1030-1]PYH45875.1 hypothetical protein BP01DRAFT_339106 [Aspergillus saccharolyticus JOP 1030-1]
MASSNDLRGWVMSAVSGAACVLGSSVICVDILLRHLSRRKDFQIVHNNAFLSASLCLSAGVMLFTSLYSMLPTSHSYLIRAGWSPSSSAYVLIGLFLAGVVVIRFASALLHRYIPSHVVGCDHTHEPHPKSTHDHEHNEHHHEHPDESHTWNERTPLLSRSFKSSPATITLPDANPRTQAALQRRESLRDRLTRRFSRMVGVKAQCDENGPCFGFSQACGHECTKTLVTTPEVSDVGEDLVRPHLQQARSLSVHVGSTQPTDLESGLPHLHDPHHPHHHEASSSSSHTGLLDDQCQPLEDSPHKPPVSTTGAQQPHHHHVPQNAFLLIGLQTSVAIALHKLPEGFITYATNHASPTLGLTVFLALFIHNISEGFAMALPLYLALHSRGWAMFWSSLLGGISQPAGAGLAALWIWAARRANGDDAAGPSWGVYGGMFAATAGVMTSVALQLFSEGLTLTHHHGMCTGFAIGGMVLMGLSFALTA